MNEGSLPLPLLGRWAQASKEGKRALQALCAGRDETMAKKRLSEAVESLLGVCDELVVWWSDAEGGCDGAIAVLIEAMCNEASLRHQASLGLTPASVRTLLVVWRLQPFVVGPDAEAARAELEVRRLQREARERPVVG